MKETEKITPAEQGGDVSDVDKIERFIEQIASEYRAAGIPINNDGRLDMQAYSKLYLDVEKDTARTREWEKEWFGDVPEKDIGEKRRMMEGEQLEMLTYAIFTKYLGEDFVVARTSPHDDRVNKVDTIILDRKTGALVCAFDEVGDTTGVNYEKKIALVRENNLRGGASLKYGLGVKVEGDKRVLLLTSGSNIPVFYIALPPDRIKKGVKEFLPNKNIKSEFEKKLFSYFVATITAQINGLELYEKRLNPQLKDKLATFKKIMRQLKEIQEKKDSSAEQPQRIKLGG